MSDSLLARAGRLSLDTFRRECRQLAKELLARSRAGEGVDELAAQRAASKLTRWVDKVTGMHHTPIELDPIRDARLHSLANAELARIATMRRLCCDAEIIPVVMGGDGETLVV